MTDEELIAEVARVWVDGGGDAAGIDWSLWRLKDAVQAEVDLRNEIANGLSDEEIEQD